MILLFENEYEREKREMFEQGVMSAKLIIFQMMREWDEKHKGELMEEKENGSEGR